MSEKPSQDNIITEIEQILENKEDVANVSEEEKQKKEKNYNGGKYNNPMSCIGQLGGARPGAGMPKGHKTKKTMEAKVAEEYIRKRVLGALPSIMNSQMSLARGCNYLFKLEKIYDSKSGKWVIPKGRQPKIVKDKEEIAKYIAGDFEGKEECDYYFMTTEKPDNKALDSLLDRTLGKATQKSEVKVGLTMHDLLEELNN